MKNSNNSYCTESRSKCQSWGSFLWACKTRCCPDFVWHWQTWTHQECIRRLLCDGWWMWPFHCRPHRRIFRNKNKLDLSYEIKRMHTHIWLPAYVRLKSVWPGWLVHEGIVDGRVLFVFSLEIISFVFLCVSLILYFTRSIYSIGILSWPKWQNTFEII